MAVRNESVRLSLDDQFTSQMARATAATALFKRELDGLDGKKVSTDLDNTAKGADKVGQSSSKAGPEIDKLSGRLRLLTDAAVTLGPALIPLGAGTIPVLTGSLMGLTSAAGGIGVAIAAFTGLGDALTALNDYQLEPTAENLQALRIEQEKMGPSGAAFVRYLDSLGPVLKDLQFTARDGLFPGVEDGIDSLLGRLPEVTKIVNRLSQTMGDLAAGAGASLGGPDFDAFFQYLKTDAAPTLESFSKSLGNVFLGLANMLVAFAPASRDFTTGLEDMTKRFAEWTAGLENNDSFQSFLDYVRESGPQAVEFIAAIAKALAGLVEAAAPLGSVVLPALTGLANAFAAIAGSPIGPGLYTAAAALIAFNRATVVAEKSSTRFSTAWSKMSRAGALQGAAGALGLMAASATDLDDKLGLANSSMGAMAGLMVGGPWGAAIGLSAGVVMDLADANEQLSAQIDAVRDSIRANDLDTARQQLQELRTEYEKLSNPDLIAPFDLSAQWNSTKAALFGFTGKTRELGGAIDETAGAMSQGGDIADLFGQSIGQTGQQFRVAANGAEELTGALAALNDWLDKGDAIANYRAGIKDLAKGLKDGFNPEIAQSIRDQGRNIIDVAKLIKDPGTKADFLAGARASLLDLAQNAGPKAEAAVRRLVERMDSNGLTHPPPIEITADDKDAQAKVKKNKRDLDILGRSTVEPEIGADDNPFRQTYGTVKGAMREANRLRAEPKVDVNPGNSFGILGGIRSELARIVSKTITVTVKKIGNAIPEFAEGGYTGAGGMYEPRGIVHAGEVVIPQRYVRRDFASLKARYPDLPGFADGGLVQNTYTSRRDSDSDEDKAGKDQDRKTRHTVTLFLEGMTGATHGFKALQKVLKAEEEQRKKAFDRAKSARDEAIGRRDALAGSISSGLAGDIWADREASDNPWMAGATAGGKATPASALAALQKQRADTQRFLVALNTLKQKGITGPVLAEIIGTGDVDRAEMMAALPIEELTSFASVYTAAQGELAAAGLAGGNALEGQNIKVLEKELRGARQELREIRQAINNSAAKHEQAVDKAADKTGEKVKNGVNGAGTKGRRNKVYAR